MSLADWSPIIASIVVVVGGSIAYWNQKRLDQKAQLVELRREAYQAFVDAMIRTTSADARGSSDKDEAFEMYHRASGQMTVVASDEVLEKLADFQLDRSKSALDIEESSKQLLLALRKDVFEGSRVTDLTIRNAYPIKFGAKK